MKDYYDSVVKFVKLIRIKKYWITIYKETDKKTGSVKIFYNHWMHDIDDMRRDFNKQWMSCRISLRERFTNDGLTFKHFNDILNSLDELFTNKYNLIYRFITTYPEEDDYAHTVYDSMCNVLQSIFNLLIEYTKELTKIIINDDDNYDLTYIKESIKHIGDYHVEC